MPEKMKSHVWTVFFIMVGVLILILIGLVSWQVPYVVKENYDESEPYEFQEAYQEQEPYQKQVDLQYKVVENDKVNCGDLFNYILCQNVKIENIDTEGGTFEINCGFKTLYKTLSDTDSTYIGAGESKKLVCSGDVDFTEDTQAYYTVSPGTKTVTEYRTVTKYRTAIGYHDVTNQRDVTKYCSALDKFMGNC